VIAAAETELSPRQALISEVFYSQQRDVFLFGNIRNMQECYQQEYLD
jgi:hypothetical protein